MNDLCIGGGGFTGLSFIGSLEYIDKNELLDLKNFYGTSIGSLIGVAYIIGIKPIQMLNFILKLNLNEIVNYNIENFASYHILDEKLLDNLIEVLFIKEDNINYDLTIKDISDKSGININIYVTNLTDNKYESFNNKDTPNIKIIDALKASMSIPFLFKPVKINDKLYIDGCCKNIIGIPPDDIYICGYTIILETTEGNYISDVLNALIYRPKPRTTFLVKCKPILPLNTYGQLNKIDNNSMIKMYKHGISATREMCNI